MTDRGLPIVDGAPACPFVAFEDDRDARAASPDHRHRCYAETRPAPRALAHQAAYCLSSAFPVCPSFQDWARREAAQARAGEAPRSPEEGDHVSSTPGGPPDRTAGSPGSVHRNPPRDWAAPPPWVAGAHDADADVDEDENEPDIQALPPVRRGGLSGSFADRLAGGSSNPPRRLPVRWDGDEAAVDDDEDEDEAARTAPAAATRSRTPVGSPPPRERRVGRDERRPVSDGVPGPSWERPRRMEAYPTLKSRMGLPSLSPSPILIGVAALAIAAVALFLLPTLLGWFGNPPDTGAGPTPTATASAETSGTPAPPTPTPGPTQQVYVVQAGDTMSRIANRFGVPLQTLIDANKETVPNPDVLEIGQEVLIPSVAPTSLPDAGTSPAP
ncbi:MAG: hypothetical protein C0498_07535 [Anaerolinea sp.]|nr:hypothetical protein [Anaerolinea sp.]